MNASLAFIEGAKPEGEVECALVIQMACTHTAAMAVLQRLGGGHGGDRSVAAMATAAARLLRAYATQVETLRRWKNGGSQVVRVEHVHVNEGGQALIGNVRKDSGGKDRSPTLDLDSSSQQVAHAPHPALRSPNAERELVPGAGDADRPMRMHGRPSPGAPKGNKNAFGDTLGDTEGFDRTSEFGAKGDCPTKCPIGTLGTVGRGAAGASSVEYCGRQAYDAAQAAPAAPQRTD